MNLYDTVLGLSARQKRTILLAVDVLLIGVSHLLVVTLLLGPATTATLPTHVLVDLALMMGAGLVLTAILGLHRIKLNAYEMQGVIDSAFVAMMIVAAGLIGGFFMPGVTTPAYVYVVTGMLFLILSVSARLVMRQILLHIYAKNKPRTRIAIYGAGQTGQQLAVALATDDSVQPVAFIDDDPRKQNVLVAGLRVFKPSKLADLIERHQLERVVLAMPSASGTIRASIITRLASLPVEVHTMPSFADLIADTGKTLMDTKRIDPCDLLGREPLDAELPGSSTTYKGRSVLITGAGGSIGSELCRQLLVNGPRRLVLLDHGEHALFNIDRELRALAPDMVIETVLGSVCDKRLIGEILEDHAVEIVFHAAAYKHVSLVERNALEGMRNNVLGTKTVADAAREAGVERFILISTDKAVRPASAMGASKRMAEMCVQDLATRPDQTRFSMVRFGNVLGSSGSVLPLFQEQIARGGPLTLTHMDVTRYFMTIPEAVRLVLLAGTFARGGDVFALDMGKPVPIRTIARQMIEAANKTVRDKNNPDGDIEIRITGLRPGEKLHEELLIGSDMLTTPHPKILRAEESHLSEIEMANLLQILRQAVETRNLDMLEMILAKWIEKPEKTDAVSNLDG